MGASGSKIEEDKALLLCHERRRFVKQALDGRCSLAAAHFAYIQCLRNTGIALGKFVEPELPAESSLYTSTSATPEPPAIRHKSKLQFSNLSPSVSQRYSLSPVPSPLSSGRIHVNHMKASRNSVTTIEEKPPIPVTATLRNSTPIRKASVSELDDSSTFGTQAPPGTPPWDYFGLFHPVENQFSYEEGSGLGHALENADDIRRLQEGEGLPELEEEGENSSTNGIPELEEEGENSSTNGREDNFGDSEDDFDKSSSEPLVRMYKNRNISLDHHMIDELPMHSPKSFASENEKRKMDKGTPDIGMYEDDKTPIRTPPRVRETTEKEKGEKSMLDIGMYDEADETPVRTPPRIIATAEKTKGERSMPDIIGMHDEADETPVRTPPTVRATAEKRKGKNSTLDIGISGADETPVRTPPKVIALPDALPMNGKPREPYQDGRHVVKDLFLCMKEIESLFLKAFDSGKEVSRMLEADEFHLRPLLSEEIARGSKASSLLTSFFICCTEDVRLPLDPTPAEVKYLTWHRSVSSLSSSSRNPLGVGNDSMDGLTGVYMNSGSHVSTLDRLYAWERKLYDEVKASGTIRREYDMKCRLLRNQDARGERQNDKTRAAIKDLHSRIKVAIHRIDDISKTIEKLRDNELQPQLEELIGSLTRMWATMADVHRHQHEIILLVSNNGIMKVSVRSESQRQATVVLEVELNTLASSFTKWISSHRSYLQSLNSWLGKCVIPIKQQGSRRKRNNKVSLRNSGAPPIFATCEDWIKLLDDLPTKEVADATKALAGAVSHLLPRQEKRHATSKLNFSVSQNGVVNGGTTEEFHRNNSPIENDMNCERLQSCLVVFLERLKVFAESSLQKYEELQKSIDEARYIYEKGKRL